MRAPVSTSGARRGVAARPVGTPIAFEDLEEAVGGFDTRSFGFDPHGYGSGPVQPLRPLDGLTVGPQPYLQFQFEHPGTGVGAQWNNGEWSPVKSFEANRFSADVTPKGTTFNYDQPTVVPGLTYGPRVEVGNDGHVDLQAGVKFGGPEANAEVGVQHIQDTFSRAQVDTRVDILHNAWDEAHRNPSTENFNRLAAAERAFTDNGVPMSSVRQLEGLPKDQPNTPTVFENTPGSPGAGAAAAMNDPHIAMNQQAFDYMQQNHITLQDAQAAAARGEPITVPGGSNATSDWGPQQIIPSGPLAGPLAAPFELQPAPLPATTNDLMHSLGYSQEQIDAINTHNAGQPDQQPQQATEPQQFQQYSELGPNNELGNAYNDAHQYDQASELGPHNELGNAYNDAHQYDQYNEYGPNNELLNTNAYNNNDSAPTAAPDPAPAADPSPDPTPDTSYQETGDPGGGDSSVA